MDFKYEILILTLAFAIILIGCFFTLKYLWKWLKSKIYSSQPRLAKIIEFLTEDDKEITPNHSSEKLKHQIKKGKNLYKALQNYTEDHTFEGVNSLSHHLRYGVTRAESEMYLQQLKSLAIEADRCSELIKQHISATIKEVNSKEISPNFNTQSSSNHSNKTTTTDNENSNESNSDKTKNESKIPESSIKLEDIKSNSYYTFIGYDAKNGTNKRYQGIQGSVLRSILTAIKNNQKPADNVYPLYLETNPSNYKITTT